MQKINLRVQRLDEADLLHLAQLDMLAAVAPRVLHRELELGWLGQRRLTG